MQYAPTTRFLNECGHGRDESRPYGREIKPPRAVGAPLHRRGIGVVVWCVVTITRYALL
jgi:hypothetical protein